MRTIGVVTVARSDYGIYLPLLRKIQEDPDLQLHLIVSGMHLSPEFGLTVERIEADGFEVDERVEMLLSSDSPEGIAKSMGLGIIGFAQSYAHLRPDILVVLGDRFEMHSAALAALPFKIPIAHIHGGEVTQGAIDDALRHSMTKLSHLHFVSTQEYAERVIQLGEEPWRVNVVGALSLDNLSEIELRSAPELEAKYGLRLDQSPLLVTFHPVTLEYEQTEWQMNELLTAIEDVDLPVIFTKPNADTNSRVIIRMLEEYVRVHGSAWLVDNFGTQDYFSTMAVATAMVGNSSSGIIEAASFQLPVINVGNRQKGRIHTDNVIHTNYERSAIKQAILRAISSEFRTGLSGLKNPYGDGNAASQIVTVLKNTRISSELIMKSFYDG